MPDRVKGFLRHAVIIALRAAAYFAPDDLNLGVVVIRSDAESALPSFEPGVGGHS